MSTDRRLVVGALVLGVVSLGYLSWFHITSGQRMKVAAEDAVRKREDALLRELAPKLEGVCRQANVRMPERPPERVEELLDPLFNLLEPSRKVGEGEQTPPK